MLATTSLLKYLLILTVNVSNVYLDIILTMVFVSLRLIIVNNMDILIIKVIGLPIGTMAVEEYVKYVNLDIILIKTINANL